MLADNVVRNVNVNGRKDENLYFEITNLDKYENQVW